jgi:hypothetical protein
MPQTQKANTPEISAQKVQVQLLRLRQLKKKKKEEQEGARRLSVLLIKWVFSLPSELPQHCSYLLLLPPPHSLFLFFVNQCPFRQCRSW